MSGYGTTNNWWPQYQQWQSQAPKRAASVSNESVAELGKADEPTNWLQKFAITAIVAVVLASVAIAIAVPLLKSRGPQPDNIDIQFNMTFMMQFQPGMEDTSSLIFHAFETNLCQLLLPILTTPGSIGANYLTQTCQVLALTNGSIKARVKSSFHVADTTQTSMLAIHNALYTAFVRSVQNDTFGLPVDPTSFDIYGMSESAATDPCNLHNCDQICVPDSNSDTFTCACFQGFTRNGNVCIGKDICGLREDKCDHVTTYCMNEEANTFSCPCMPGYYQPQPPDQPGPMPTSCLDIDECTTTPWVCNANTSTCNNTIGGYVCNCLPGFQPSYTTMNVCNDIDECGLQLDHCDYTTTMCMNTPGNYTCMCRPGFANYSMTRQWYCDDVDECSTMNNTCNMNTSMCMNTFGSYWCQCNYPNFTMNMASHTCMDVNECALQTDLCNVYTEMCVNEWGGYTCPCAPGYEVVVDVCEDIDECLNATYCPNMNCSNTPGSYYCFCPPGYTTVWTNGMGACQDINECVATASPCVLTDSYCNNTMGSYDCVCKYSDNTFLTFPLDSSNNCQMGEFAFYVKSTSLTASGASAVSYDTISLNVDFFQRSPPLTQINPSPVPMLSNSWYWVYQSLAATGPAAVNTQGAGNTLPVVLNGNGASNWDMTSAGIVQQTSNVAAPFQTTVATGQPTGDGTHDTSFLAFNLDGFVYGYWGWRSITAMNTATPSSNILTLSQLSQNPAPIFISMTTQADVNANHTAQLSLNSAMVLQNRFDRNDATTPESVTSATVIMANINDIFTLQVTSGSMCGSASSLCVLNYIEYTLYDTRYTTALWSVYRSTPELQSGSSPVMVTYDQVIIGDLWNATTNMVQVPVTGVYYINLNVATAPANALDLQLYVNGAPASFGIKRATATTGVVTRSRAGLFSLNQGDNVCVKLVSGALYGDLNRLTSFSGFLLYAH